MLWKSQASLRSGPVALALRQLDAVLEAFSGEAPQMAAADVALAACDVASPLLCCASSEESNAALVRSLLVRASALVRAGTAAGNEGFIVHTR